MTGLGGGADVGSARRGAGSLTWWQLRRAWLAGGYGLGLNIMINFLAPLRASELGASLFWIGIIVGVPAVGPAVFGFAIGALSDRLGARRTFQLATAGTVATTGAMALAGSWQVLLVLQVLHGPLRAAGWVSSQSYITTLDDDPANRVRNTSRFAFVTASSRTAMPLAVAAVADWLGLRFAFVAVAVYSALCFLLALSLADRGPTAPAEGEEKGDVGSGAVSSERPEEKAGSGTGGPGTAAGPAQAGPTRGRRDAVDLLRTPGIQVAFLLSFARVWASSVLVAFYSLLLVERGLSKTVAGLVVSANAGTAMVMTLLVTGLTGVMSKQALTALGLAAGAVGFALVPATAGTALAFVPAVLAGIGEGFSLPLLIAIVGEVAPARLQGMAIGMRIGVNQGAQFTASALMGTVTGAVGLAGGFPVAGAVTAAVLAAAMARHLLPRPERPG